jgi:hypothetical protein
MSRCFSEILPVILNLKFSQKWGLVGGSAKFGRRAKSSRENEDFFLEAVIDRVYQKV